MLTFVIACAAFAAVLAFGDRSRRVPETDEGRTRRKFLRRCRPGERSQVRGRRLFGEPQVSSTSSRTCGRMIRGAAVATRAAECKRVIAGVMATVGRNPARRASGPAARASAAAHVPAADRAAVREIAGPDGCAPLEPRRLGATVRSTRSHRPAGGAGGGTGAGARADPLRTDVGLAVCLLPRCGVRYGLGPSRFAAEPACRCSFAAMRIWPISAPSPRRSGSCSSTSTTSTRRFPAREGGMGREAFGSQRCRRRPRERLRG